MKLSSTTIGLEDSKRAHSLDVDDIRRRQRNDMEDLRDRNRQDEERARKDSLDELEKLSRKHADEITSMELRLKGGAQEEIDRLRHTNADEVALLDGRRRKELEEEQQRRTREVLDISTQLAVLRQNAELDASGRDRDVQNLRDDLDRSDRELVLERSLNDSLKVKLVDSTTHTKELEASNTALQNKITFLESDTQAQSQAFADLNAKTAEAIKAAEEANTKLRTEETLRRKLHNQVQELKGNIRVFCRVRPALEVQSEDEVAKMAYPDDDLDSKELTVMGPEQKSALGKDTTSKNGFVFDRVFGPSSQNGEVFEEISQLVQSALDGYNVCIFCYGQTGSGKTHTMSSSDGMIPLAVNQIYESAKELEEKGWNYTMEGSFVEVYNENLNDLLGQADDLDKKKYEIRHDLAKGKTTITDVNTVLLDSPNTVTTLLKRAAANRSVAATKANERSSRSHSVFILKLLGENSITGEHSEGTLNLVDLAGSERLNHSGATGDRLKETQSINKSLSCLGDVISALGQGKDGGHIPYRNSKLTYLLQHSLGGNSKTLMFVMISPLQAHLNETLTSLKFATKVNRSLFRICI